jgi:hypothetical protein
MITGAMTSEKPLLNDAEVCQAKSCLLPVLVLDHVPSGRSFLNIGGLTVGPTNRSC